MGSYRAKKGQLRGVRDLGLSVVGKGELEIEKSDLPSPGPRR